ncbi:MAG: Ig-like domain-containing protein [Flavisolibacter sp.]
MKKNPISIGTISLRPNLSTLFSFHNKWLTFLFFALILQGCKKVSEQEGLEGICPEVSSTTPANNATNVSIATLIDATFNEKMDSSTLNNSTFLLKQGTTAIHGLISYTGMTARFSPFNNLANNTTYTATITTGAKDLAGNALVNDYVWTFTTGASVDITNPEVIATNPANAATGVELNKKISAIFSEEMDPLTINNSTFIVKQGTNVITGTFTYAGTTAVFSPTTALSSNTLYNVTITTGAKDVAGNTLLSDYNWSFTTGTLLDVTNPTVIDTDPNDLAINVAVNKKITATFSKEMNALTLNNTSFKLSSPTGIVTGVISYAGNTATFSPVSNLDLNTTYTATISTDAKDLTGNALLTDFVWTFTTGSAPPSIFLGSISLFGVFGGSAGITNQGLNTAINNGSIGTTGASTLITGLHDGTTGDIYTETPLNKGIVSGRIYTAPPAPGTATSFAIAQNALLDAINAYNSISPASKPGGTDPGAGELGGLTLAPGVYKSASGTFNITNGDLTLDAMGDPNATWIFQTAAGLTVGLAGPAGARSVNLINGALAKNVYWYVGSAATINAAGGGVMTGTIISSAGVTFSTAGNAVQTVLNGRAISLNASVTLVNTTINVQ